MFVGYFGINLLGNVVNEAGLIFIGNNDVFGNLFVDGCNMNISGSTISDFRTAF